MTEEFGGSCLSTEDHVEGKTDHHLLPLETHLMSDSVTQHGPPAAKPSADVLQKDSHFTSGASPLLCRPEAELQMTDCQAPAVFCDVIGEPASLDENKMDFFPLNTQEGYQKGNHMEAVGSVSQTATTVESQKKKTSAALVTSQRDTTETNCIRDEENDCDNKTDLLTVSTGATLSGQTAAAVTENIIPSTHKEQGKEESELSAETDCNTSADLLNKSDTAQETVLCSRPTTGPKKKRRSRKSSSVALKEDPRITCDDGETSTRIPAEISSVDFSPVNTQERYQNEDHMEARGSVSQTPANVESQKKAYYSVLHQMQQQQKHRPGRRFKKKTLMKMAKLFVTAKESDLGKIQSPPSKEPSAEHEIFLLNQEGEMFPSAALVTSQRDTTETNCVGDEENDCDSKNDLLTVSTDASLSGQTAAAVTFEKMRIPSTHKEQGKEESELSVETDCNMSADLLNKSDTAQETVLCSRPTTGPKKKRRSRKSSSVTLKEDPRITCDDGETSTRIPAEISSVDAPKTKVFKQRKETARASKVSAKKKIQELFTEFNDVKTQDVSEGLLKSHNEQVLAHSSPVQDKIFKGVDLNADKQENIKSEPSELTSEKASSFQDETSPDQSVPSVVPARKIRKRQKMNNFDKETDLSTVSTDATLSGQTAAAVTVKKRKIYFTHKKRGKEELKVSAETDCNTSADLLNKSDTAQETVLCTRPTTGPKTKRRLRKSSSVTLKEDPRISCDDSETSTRIPAEISSVDFLPRNTQEGYQKGNHMEAGGSVSQTPTTIESQKKETYYSVLHQMQQQQKHRPGRRFKKKTLMKMAKLFVTAKESDLGKIQSPPSKEPSAEHETFLLNQEGEMFSSAALVTSQRDTTETICVRDEEKDCDSKTDLLTVSTDASLSGQTAAAVTFEKMRIPSTHKEQGKEESELSVETDCNTSADLLNKSDTAQETVLCSRPTTGPKKKRRSRKSSSVTLKEDPRITCYDGETSTSIPAEISSVDAPKTKVFKQRKKTARASKVSAKKKIQKLFTEFNDVKTQDASEGLLKSHNEQVLAYSSPVQDRIIKGVDLNADKPEQIKSDPSELTSEKASSFQEETSPDQFVPSVVPVRKITIKRKKRNNSDKETDLSTVSTDATLLEQTAAAITVKKRKIYFTHKKRGKEELKLSVETDCNTSADLLNKSDTAQETVLCTRPTTGPKKKRRSRKSSSVTLKEDPRITCDDSETSTRIPAEISSVDAPKTKVFKQRKKTARASKVEVKKNIEQKNQFIDVKTQDVSEGLLISHNQPDNSSSIINYNKVDSNSDKPEHIKSEPSELTSEKASSFQDETSPDQSVPSRKNNSVTLKEDPRISCDDSETSTSIPAEISSVDFSPLNTQERYQNENHMEAGGSVSQTPANVESQKKKAYYSVLHQMQQQQKHRPGRRFKKKTLMKMAKLFVIAKESDLGKIQSPPSKEPSAEHETFLLNQEGEMFPSAALVTSQRDTTETICVGDEENVCDNKTDLLTVSTDASLSGQTAAAVTFEKIRIPSTHKEQGKEESELSVETDCNTSADLLNKSDTAQETVLCSRPTTGPKKKRRSRKSSSVTLKEDPRITCYDGETSTRIPAEISSVDAPKAKVFKQRKKTARASKVSAKKKIQELFTEFNDVKTQDVSEGLLKSHNEQVLAHSSPVQDRIIKGVDLNADKPEQIKTEPSELISEKASSFEDETSPDQLVPSVVPARKIRKRQKRNNFDKETDLSTVSTDATLSGQTAAAITVKKRKTPFTRKKHGKEELKLPVETDCNTSADLLNKSDTAQETVLCTRPTTGPKKKRRLRKCSSVTLKEDPRITFDDGETSTSIPAEISSVDAPKTKVFKQRKKTARASKVGVKKKKQKPFTEFIDVKTQNVSEGLMMSHNESLPDYSSSIQDKNFNKVDLNADKPEHTKTEPSELTSEKASSFQDETSPDQSVPSRKNNSAALKEDPRISCDDSETSTGIPAEISSVDFSPLNTQEGYQNENHMEAGGSVSQTPANVESQKKAYYSVLHQMQQQQKHRPGRRFKKKTLMKMAKLFVTAKESDLGKIQSPPSKEPSAEHEIFLLNQEGEMFPSAALVTSQRDKTETICVRDEEKDCDSKNDLLTVSTDASLSGQTAAAVTFEKMRIPSTHKEQGKEESELSVETDCNTSADLLNKSDTAQETVLCSRPTTGPKKKRRSRKSSSVTLKEDPRITCDDGETSTRIPAEISSVDAPKTKVFKQRKETARASKVSAKKKIQELFTEFNDVKTQDASEGLLKSHNEQVLAYSSPVQDKIFKGVDFNADKQEQIKTEPSELTSEKASSFQDETSPDQSVPSRKNNSVTLKEDPRISCDDSETSTRIPAEIFSVDFLPPNTQEGYQNEDHMEAGGSVSQTPANVESQKKAYYSVLHQIQQQQKHRPGRRFKKKTLMKMAKLFVTAKESDLGKIQSPPSNEPSAEHETFLLNQEGEMFPSAALVTSQRDTTETICVRDEENDCDNKTDLLTVSTDASLSGQTAAAVTFEKMRIPSTHKEQGKEESELSVETDCNTSVDLLNKSDTAQETVLCSRPTTGPKKKRRSRKSSSVTLKEDPRITCDDGETSTSVPAEISSVDAPKTKVFKQRKETARASKVSAKKKIQELFTEFNDVKTQDASEGLLKSHNEQVLAYSSPVQDRIIKGVDLNADKPEHIKSEPSELTSEKASSFQDETSPDQSVPSRKNNSVTLNEDPRISCDDSETSTSIPAEISSVDFSPLNTQERYQNENNMEAGGSVSQTPANVESQKKKTYYSVLHQMQQQQKHRPGRRFKKKTLMKMAKLFVTAKESDLGKIQSPPSKEPSAEHETFLLNQEGEMFPSAALVTSQRDTTETNCVGDEENDCDSKNDLLTVSTDASLSGQTAAAVTFEKIRIPSTHKEEGKEESELSVETDCNMSADLLNKSDTAQETVLCFRPTTGPKKKRRSRKSSSVTLKEDPRIICDDGETSTRIPAEISSVDAPKTKVFKQRKKTRTSKVGVKKNIEQKPEFNNAKTQDVSEGLLMSHNEQVLAYFSPVQDKIFKGVDLNADKQEQIKSEPSELTSEKASSFQEETSPDQSVPSVIPARKIRKRQKKNNFDKETDLLTVSTDASLSGQTAAAVTFEKKRIPSTHKEQGKEESELSVETDCNTSADMLNKSDTAQETVLCSRPTTGPKKKRRLRKSSSVTLKEDPRITCDDGETSTSIPAEISSVDAPKTKVFKQRKKTARASKVGVKKDKQKPFTEFNDVKTQDVSEGLLMSHNEQVLTNSSSIQDTNFNKVDLNADKQELVKTEPSELISEKASLFQDETSLDQFVPSVVPARKTIRKRRKRNKTGWTAVKKSKRPQVGHPPDDDVTQRNTALTANAKVENSSKPKSHSPRRQEVKPRKPLECSFCRRSFRHITALTVHKRIHTGEKPYSCPTCGKRFAQLSQLSVHSTTHGEPPAVCCPCCGETFKSKDELIFHFHVHLNNSQSSGVTERPAEGEQARLDSPVAPERLRCSVCLKEFLNRATLKMHGRTHGQKPYTCTVCEKKFRKPSSLHAHERTHWPVKPYSCSVCCEGFIKLQELKRHSQTHSGATPFTCPRCEKTFSSFESFRSHQAVELCSEKKDVAPGNQSGIDGFLLSSSVEGQIVTPTYFKCHVCKQLHRHWCQYVLHLRAHAHGKSSSCETCGQQSEQTGEMRDHCAVCCRVSGEERACRSSLTDIWKEPEAPENQGLELHVDNESVPPDEDQTEQISPLPQAEMSEEEVVSMRSPSSLDEDFDISSVPNLNLACNRACCSGSRPQSLIRRRFGRLSHGHCGRSFSWWNKLHQRLYRQRLTFSCSQCELEFRFMGSYMDHLREHAAQTPHACPLCPESFTSVENVSTHISECHKRPDLFPCSTCGKNFSTLRNLKKHKLLHKGTSSHACLPCSVSFCSHSALKTHLETHSRRLSVPQPAGLVEPLLFPYNCRKCTAAFSSTDLLQAHQVCHFAAGKKLESSPESVVSCIPSRPPEVSQGGASESPRPKCHLPVSNKKHLFRYPHPDRLYVVPVVSSEPPIVLSDTEGEQHETQVQSPSITTSASDTVTDFPRRPPGAAFTSSDPSFSDTPLLSGVSSPGDMHEHEKHRDVGKDASDMSGCDSDPDELLFTKEMDRVHNVHSCAICMEPFTDISKLHEHYICHVRRM